MRPLITLKALGTSLLLALCAPALATGTGERACKQTTNVLKNACFAETNDDYLNAVAVCLNDDDSGACVSNALGEATAALRDCRKVTQARRKLCQEVGGGPYQPAFGEDYDFVNPLLIGAGVEPNPYLPLIPGNKWVYEGTFTEEDDDGNPEEITERIIVEVTDQTKLIDGVTCIVVIDEAFVDGELQESTMDWYGQNAAGDVYYCGEISENFETYEGDDPEDPELVDIEGSWKHNRDGAKAGVLLPFAPEVGQFFRQEVSWGDAEDAIEILDVKGEGSVVLANGSTVDCLGECLVTRDFTPLEPDVEENKTYVPGIGLIREVDPENPDEPVALIAYCNVDVDPENCPTEAPEE